MRGSCLCLLFLLVLAGCATSKPAKKRAAAKKPPVPLEAGAAWWPAMGEMGQGGENLRRPY